MKSVLSLFDPGLWNHEPDAISVALRQWPETRQTWFTRRECRVAGHSRTLAHAALVPLALRDVGESRSCDGVAAKVAVASWDELV
jgi:hypothetical protein